MRVADGGNIAVRPRLGKNIGGTLGMPFEGKRDLNNVTFYTHLKDGQAAPNDDIDLPLGTGNCSGAALASV